MGNHIQLALQVSDETLSKIMQSLGFRYTRWINKQQKRILELVRTYISGGKR